MSRRLGRLQALASILAIGVMATGCADDQATEPIESTGPTPTAAPAPLDGLDIRLELRSTTATSGEAIGSDLIVENHTGGPLSVPVCMFGGRASAFVPRSEPDAELWNAATVDCSTGHIELPRGFTERYRGPWFPATDKFDDPLPPGDYLAALEIETYSERLEVQVTVIFANP